MARKKIAPRGVRPEQYEIAPPSCYPLGSYELRCILADKPPFQTTGFYQRQSRPRTLNSTRRVAGLWRIKGALIARCVPLLAPHGLGTQPSATAPADTHDADISSSKHWIDSGVNVAPGQSLTISATGSLQFSDGASATPQGATRGWKDLVRSMAANSAGRGALIRRMKVRVPGRLFFGFNGTSSDTLRAVFTAASIRTSKSL